MRSNPMERLQRSRRRSRRILGAALLFFAAAFGTSAYWLWYPRSASLDGEANAPNGAQHSETENGAAGAGPGNPGSGRSPASVSPARPATPVRAVPRGGIQRASRPDLPWNPFAGASVLSSAESSPDGNGNYTRTTLLRTNFKYPLLRVDEKFGPDPDTGAIRFQGKEVMVADHVIVKLESGYSESDLKKALAGRDLQIRRHSQLSDFYLVSFDGTNAHAIEDAIASLSRAKQVNYSEPDFIYHTM